MRQPKIIIVAILLLSLLGVYVALAARDDGTWKRLDKRLERVGLTETQKQSVAELKDQFAKKTELLRAELSTKKKEFKELRSQGSSEQGTTAKKREEVRALRDQIRSEKTALGAQLWGILSPEQQKKLGENVQKLQNLLASQRNKFHLDSWN